MIQPYRYQISWGKSLPPPEKLELFLKTHLIVSSNQERLKASHVCSGTYAKELTGSDCKSPLHCIHR